MVEPSVWEICIFIYICVLYVICYMLSCGDFPVWKSNIVGHKMVEPGVGKYLYSCFYFYFYCYILYIFVVGFSGLKSNIGGREYTLYRIV